MGYDNWGIPTRTNGGKKELRRKMQTQFWYGTLAVAEGDLLEYFPQRQLYRMMPSYHERKLKEYELTEEFQKSQEDIYFLLIQLHKSHRKEASEKQSVEKNRLSC